MTIRLTRLLYLVTIALLLTSWSSAARAQSKPGDLPEWREFKSEAGGFSVKLPGTPKLSQSSFEKGSTTFTRFSHSLQVAHLSFDVDYMDLPPGYGDADLSLEGGISGMIQSMTIRGATLLTKETIVRGTCEAREASLSLNNPSSAVRGYGAGRVFNAGQRYYFMVFVSREDTPAARQTAGIFFESFDIKGGCNRMIAPVEAPEKVTTDEDFPGVVDPVTGWLKVEDANLGISVLMPGKIRHQTDRAQIKPFPLTHHTFINSKEGNVYSAEVFGEYPAGFHSGQASYLTVVDVTLYGLKKNMGSLGFEFRPLRDLRVGQYPGREFAMVSEKLGSSGRAQIYVTPKHIYVFIAFAHDQGVTLKLLDRFFSSIRVLPK
jgi:hypothetical protein